MATQQGVGRDDEGDRTVLRLQGEYWTIAYDGIVMRLRDTRGLRYLEILLRHPGQAFNVADLATMAVDARRTVDMQRTEAAERVRKAVTNRIRAAITRIGASHRTLGLHLTNAVHTGAACRYTPERPVTWQT